LLLNLVNKTKCKLRLHRICNIVIEKDKIYRSEVSNAWAVTVGHVINAPVMASYHEWARLDFLAIGHLFGRRVAFDHEQVVATGCASVDHVRHGGNAKLAVGNDRYTGERRDASASQPRYDPVNRRDTICGDIPL
jgi:hypothetical protein